MFSDSSSLLSPMLKDALEREQEHCLQLLLQYEQKVVELRKRLDHIQALLGQPVPLIDTITALAPLQPAPILSTARYRKEIKASEAPSSRGGRSSNIPFRPPYTGETMLTAIAMVLRSRLGEGVTIGEVVDVLYGPLSEENYKVAKDRVTKSLSKGKKDKLWSRVPNMMGCYMLDK